MCDWSIVTSSPNAGVHAPSSLRVTLVARASRLDLVALAAVPAVLLAVFALPEPTRRSLAFAYHDPTALTALSAHYVHFDPNHLLANLAGYGLLAGVGYLLAAASRRRRFFFVAFSTVCVAFPVVLSALNLAVPRRAVGFGFSGVNMAFAGLLPLFLAAFVHTRLRPAPRAVADGSSGPGSSSGPGGSSAADGSSGPNTSLSPDGPTEPFSESTPVRLLPATFFVLVGWMASLALPASTEWTGLVGPAVAASGLVLGASQTLLLPTERRPSLRALFRRVIDRRGDGDLFAVGVVLAVSYPLVGFPAEPSTAGRVINLYVHLLGFCLGFIGPYAMLAAGVFDE